MPMGDHLQNMEDRSENHSGIERECTLIQQIELEFEHLEKYIQKCRMLLDNTNKHRMYPTKPETEGAISSLDNLTVICSSEEITNDTKLLRELLNFARIRNWKNVKTIILSVCMELDAAECKYLKKEGVISVLNKPDIIELANFGVWRECSTCNLGNEIQENDDQPYSGTGESFNDYLPTSIAKQFCSIYDNDWSEAFNQINEHFEREKEDDIVKNIAVVPQLVFEYIKVKVKTQVDNMAIAMARVAVEPLKQKSQKDFKTMNQFSRKLKSIVVLSKVTNLIDKCSNISWQMTIMEPPMIVLWPTETSKEHLFYYFRNFTKFGTELEHGVWPALLLYKDGPIMVKGAAQLK